MNELGDSAINFIARPWAKTELLDGDGSHGGCERRVRLGWHFVSLSTADVHVYQVKE